MYDVMGRVLTCAKYMLKTSKYHASFTFFSMTELITYNVYKNFNIKKVVPIEYIIKKLITMVYIYIVRIVNYK